MSFNPVKADKTGTEQRVQWSTATLELAIKGLNEGRKLVSNPFYNNKTYLLKGDLVFKHTADEINEWKKCKHDIIYFANTYCKLMTPDGVKNITLREYQTEYLNHLIENRLSILCSCRQSGKTTTSAIFLLWFILFNVDKNALVTGNKYKTAREILDKIKSIFEALPHFLKPGIYKWNEAEIALDNGCKCIAEATTDKSGIGFTFHVVLADEFAHIQPNIKESFYTNLFPVITAGRARFIITSTQNGTELFSQLFVGAENNENEYKAFKINWWDIPEWDDTTRSWVKRDEEWHRMQVGNLGSEEAFQLQYGTNFTAGSNSLIPNKRLIENSVKAKKFVVKDMPGISGYDMFYWDPDYDISNLRNELLVFTTDIAEGINGDSTVQVINKIVEQYDDSVVTNTIGFFKTNNKQYGECCEILAEFYDKYLDSNRYLISLEYNLYGELWISTFKNLIEKHNYTNFSEENFIKYFNEKMTSYWLGIRMTAKSKKLACNLFKSEYLNGTVQNHSTMFLSELRNFVDKNGNGTYAACFGHDDVVMAQIQISLVKQTQQFKDLALMLDNSQLNVFSNYNYFDLFDSSVGYPTGEYNNFYNLIK